MKNHQVSKLQGALCALIAGVVAAAVPFSAAAWEPTKPVEFIVPAGTGGGADQMARFIQGVVEQAQPDEAADHRRQQVGRRRRAKAFSTSRTPRATRTRSSSRCRICSRRRWRPACRSAGGPDAGRDAGARRIRAVGQRRHAVQDRQGVHRRGQGRRAKQVQDGRHRIEAGGPDHHRRDREGNPAPSSSTFRSRAAATSPCSWSASTSTRRSTIRSRRWRNGAPASFARCACSTTSACRTRTKVTADMSWNDIPTCKESGLPVEYLMLRGIFMPAGVSQEQVDYYVDLFKKVRETPEWKDVHPRRPRSTRRS